MLMLPLTKSPKLCKHQNLIDLRVIHFFHRGIFIWIFLSIDNYFYPYKIDNIFIHVEISDLLKT